MPFTILFNKEIWNIPKKNNETLMPQNGKMFNNAIEVGCSWNNYRFISRQELSLMNITFYECPIPRALCKFFLKLKSVDFLMTPSKDDLKNQCHHFLKCPRTWNINKIKPLNCNKLYKLIAMWNILLCKVPTNEACFQFLTWRGWVPTKYCLTHDEAITFIPFHKMSNNLIIHL